MDQSNRKHQDTSQPPQPQAGSLEEKVATARAVVECLVSIASGFESDEWLQKFRLVRVALAEGRLKDAIHEEARFTYENVPRPNWAVSRELANTLEEVMAVLSRQVHYPNHSEPTVDLGELPNDVTRFGRVGQELPHPGKGPYIENCPTRFRFQCPRRWEQLIATSDSAIRHCEECQKNVYLCNTKAEANERAKAGDCVAIVVATSTTPVKFLGLVYLD